MTRSPARHEDPSRDSGTSQLTEVRLMLALQAGGAGTWHWDRRSGRLHWDAALEELYGLGAGTFGGTYEDWVALLHPADRDEVLAAVERSVERGGAHEVEHRIVRPDGSVRWMHGRGQAVRGDGGEVESMLGVAIDVTDRQEAEAQRAQLLRAERRARSRMTFLAEASAMLARSLDVDTTLSEIADLAVPRLGDICAIELLEHDTLRLVAVAHDDADKAARVRELRRQHPPSEVHGSRRVVRTGVSEFIPEVTDEILRAAAHDEAHLRFLRELGLSSAIIVPLVARGEIIGAMQLLREDGRRHSVDDLTLAEELAHRAALAIDNARLFEERSTVAKVLQQALLPPNLPHIPGLEVVARYEAATTGLTVGGDFYDVFEHHSGSWTVLLGDVCGKGASAAALTALVRHTARAAALRDPDPVHVLRVLNDALLRHDSGEEFCTAVCARVQPAEAGADVDVVVAGHPPPVIVRGSGQVERLAPSGTLVGVFDDLALERQALRLTPGDALLAYTDGVTDARDGGRMFNEEGLVAALRAHAPARADELVDVVLEAVHRFDEGPGRRDDIALLALRATGPAGSA